MIDIIRIVISERISGMPSYKVAHSGFVDYKV